MRLCALFAVLLLGSLTMACTPTVQSRTVDQVYVVWGYDDDFLTAIDSTNGQTLWNVEGRMQGRLDSPLSDEGKAQAAVQ